MRCAFSSFCFYCWLRPGGSADPSRIPLAWETSSQVPSQFHSHWAWLGLGSRPWLPSCAGIFFGTLDLFAAIALGLTSAAGSPLQLMHAGVGSEAVQYLPFCLIPTVLVPFYLITHAIVAAQLRAQRTARLDDRFATARLTS